MSVACTCPPAAELPDLGNQDCVVKIDLVNKIVIIRDAGKTFVDITDETEFDLALAKVTDEKPVILPFISGTEVTPSEIIQTAKDDNTSPNGQGFRVGETSSTFTAMLDNLDPTIKDEIKALECYSDLNVIMYDAKGQVISLGNDAIQIRNLFVGTKGLGGRTDTDKNIIKFDLLPCWDGSLTVQANGFDINTKLNA